MPRSASRPSASSRCRRLCEPAAGVRRARVRLPEARTIVPPSMYEAASAKSSSSNRCVTWGRAESSSVLVFVQQVRRTQSAVTRCGPSTAARIASSTLRWSSASRNVVSSSKSSTWARTQRHSKQCSPSLCGHTCGCSASAPAIATRCFCPPLSVCTGRKANPCTQHNTPQQCRCVARAERCHALACRPTAVSAASTRVATSLGGSPRRPRPKATSAPVDGMTTWWSGFWKTNARGAATRRRPPSGRNKPPHTRSSVDCQEWRQRRRTGVAAQGAAVDAPCRSRSVRAACAVCPV